MNAPLCGLRRTATIGMHAQSSYYAWAELFGQLDRLPHWDGLSVREQHTWFERSADFLQRLAPVPAPSLFDQIAAVARAQAAKVLAFRGQDTSDGRD